MKFSKINYSNLFEKYELFNTLVFGLVIKQNTLISLVFELVPEWNSGYVILMISYCSSTFHSHSPLSFPEWNTLLFGLVIKWNSSLSGLNHTLLSYHSRTFHSHSRLSFLTFAQTRVPFIILFLGPDFFTRTPPTNNLPCL